MDPKLKKILRGISLEIRRLLEGRYDERGWWVPGDLEERLKGMGIWRDRDSKPIEELPQLSAEDQAARRLVDGYLKLREEAGVSRADAVGEFVRESAYTWANRLFALRCMEARGIIDEVVQQKEVYGGRSLVHHRFARKDPVACAAVDDGLYAVLFAEFAERAKELPALFKPGSAAVALRPSLGAVKRTIALLSGREAARGLEAATDEVFAAPDAFGWAYQYWNVDEKARVFEMVRTKKGAKIQGADIIPATQLYTEPYMVKFLVQNSLGALWMGMCPDSKLSEQWEYYVKDADRTPVTRKPVREVTFLDPAQGSGHFHLEAFDLFYTMYEEEAVRDGRTVSPREICAAILNHNLFGIDIDGRSVQIATAALWMKAKEKAPDLEASDLTSFHDHLVATNIRLPKERNHLELFLRKHPEDAQLRPALELVFQGLEHVDELGALVQIEQVVDATLLRLKAESDRNKGTAVQTGLFEPTLLQGSLPIGVEDFDRWKHDALERLQIHFAGEARVADPVQAFFGVSAGKGLALFELFARRYDVIAANPPYMGSKNMGTIIKSLVEHAYPAGKRDLYAAFILRCGELAAPGGRVAMVTQQSWMFLRSFAELRSGTAEENSSDNNATANGMLHFMAVEVLGHLGRYAFSEIGNAAVQPVLFVAHKKTPDRSHRIWACQLNTPRDAEAQAALLRESAQMHERNGDRHPIVHRPEQARLLEIPEAPLCYWLRGRFFELLAGPRLQDFAEVRQGLATGSNERFTRCFWEVARTGIVEDEKPTRGRWFPYAKGGRFQKWAGLEWLVVDWQANGAVLRQSTHAVCRSPHFYFRRGLTYTPISQGALGVRKLRGSVFDVKGASIFPRADSVSDNVLLAVLNTYVSSYLSRIVSQGFELHVGYLANLPVQILRPGLHGEVADTAFQLKQRVVSLAIIERTFDFRAQKEAKPISLECAVLHAIEGFNEAVVCDSLELSESDRAVVEANVGRPAGCFPLIARFDGLPPSECIVPVELNTFLARHDRYQRTDEEVQAVKQKLRQHYAAGPGRTCDVDDADRTDEEESEDKDGLAVGAHLPIPTETFLEELSQKLELHPISVYWLLKEGIEQEGWRCPPEERRLTEDRFTVTVLRMLGHRWPKQLEAGETLPTWTDQDGVIPVTNGGGERPLIQRVRERLADDYTASGVAALEREFEEIVGGSLEQWLSGQFFERHISQFKRRPIAWQLETEVRDQRSEVGGRGKGKAKKAPKASPVFSCLVYYHKVDEDLLPKIRTQCVGVLRGGFETELRTLERLANPSGEQQGRKLQLEHWVEEIKAFDQKLEQVTLVGFGPEALRSGLRQFGINDAVLSLTACLLRRLEREVGGQKSEVRDRWSDVGGQRSEVGGERAETGNWEEGRPLANWCKEADETGLHPDLGRWVGEAFSRLDYFCAVVGPKAPGQETFVIDPTSKDVAPLVCGNPRRTVEGVLELACDRWWQRFDASGLTPLKQELKQAREELERVKEELKLEEVKRDYERNMKLSDRQDELKHQVKRLRDEIEEKTRKAKQLRSHIEAWTCPDAATWDDWLGAQPLFDEIASLDGRRAPPATIAEFIAQESAYAPDINDGVRVNIAPLQRAGLLHSDVLDPKDVEKAIADRAEWRADERRWVREGKLPRPGWWPSENKDVTADNART